jgi:hypothetical protein
MACFDLELLRQTVLEMAEQGSSAAKGMGTAKSLTSKFETLSTPLVSHSAAARHDGTMISVGINPAALRP